MPYLGILGDDYVLRAKTKLFDPSIRKKLCTFPPLYVILYKAVDGRVI